MENFLKPGDGDNNNDDFNGNQCCGISNLAMMDDTAPVEPAKLFAWLAAQNLPQIEDETPPSHFHEVLSKTVYHCRRCGTLFNDLDAQKSIGTQTKLHLIQSETQTLSESIKELGARLEAQTQTDADVLLPILEQIRINASRRSRPQRFDWFRDQTAWSFLRTVLFLLSLMHGGIILCRTLFRIPLLRHLLIPFQELAPPPPPPPQSVPTFVWHQFGRLARSLHLL